MAEDKHKPLFFSTIKWAIMISIVVSIIWLVFAFVYSDTFAKNRELRAKQEESQKFRTKFRAGEPKNGQKADTTGSMIEPKKMAGVIRALSIAASMIQLLFLYGIYSNNRYLSTAFIVWTFLLAIFAFKMALNDHLFWIQAGWCLAVGLLSTQFVHSLYQVS